LDLVQHVSVALRLYRSAAAGREERFTQLLRDFDLLPLVRRKLGTLSRGQIYKAGLVILMMVDPELWLLDEPFASGMDPQGIDAFRQHARAAAGRGRTIVFTTQLLDLAERFSDRVCVLHRGTLHLCETVTALAAMNAGDDGALHQIFRQLRAGEA
jgi:ABC-type multidrug transport system ATPase subunit